MKNETNENTFDRRNFLGQVGTALLGATLGSAAGSQAAQQATRPKKRFKVIDTHFHIMNSDLQGINGIPNYYPKASIEHSLAQMDTGMVDKGFFLAYNAEDVAAEIRNRGESPEVLKPIVNHEYYLKAWRAHKDRFWWFTTVKPIRETYLEELEHDFDLGATGVKLLPMFHGLLPDNPAWLPVYELCLKRRKPIVIDWSWWYIGGEVGYGLDESRARQALCKSYTSYADWVKPMDPIFGKFSDLPISLAHCGTPKGREDYEHIFAFIARHPNCHCDLAAIPDYNPWFIGQLVKAVGVRNIMYGTDHPYWGTEIDCYLTGSRRWGVIADDCFFLSDEEKQLILAGNAERFANCEM